MSYNNDDNERNWDGTFKSGFLESSYEQLQAGINIYDSEVSASVKLYEYQLQENRKWQERRAADNERYSFSTNPHLLGQIGRETSGSHGSLKKPLLAILIIGLLVWSLHFVAERYIDNTHSLSYNVQRWALNTAFHGQEFAPWERHGSAMSRSCQRKALRIFRFLLSN